MTMAVSDDHKFDDPGVLAGEVLSLPAPLLLCTDIDGTLSTIAQRPGDARLLPGADQALRALAAAGIEVAVVSGRPIAELVRQFDLPRTLHLVGSHGVEIDQGAQRTEHESELLDRVDAVLDEIAARHDGAEVERKPFASALHVRRSQPDVADDAIRAAREAIEPIEGVHALVGHSVYEVVVRSMTKVDALAELRRRIDPASVVFIGDDQSDELVFASFAALTPDERDRVVGVKVGPGASVASRRLRKPEDVVVFLQALVQLVTA
jgi:trehalose 6-phosphate phosphatase